MLTDFEYEILAFVRANRYCAQREIINTFMSQYGCSTVKGVILSLVEKKYLAFDKVHKELNADVTPAGINAMVGYLEKVNKEARQLAKENTEYNRNTKLQILLAVITAVLSVFIEHFFGVVDFFITLLLK